MTNPSPDGIIFMETYYIQALKRGLAKFLDRTV